MTQTKYRLTEEQKMGDGEALFDFCAECLQTFINANISDFKEPGESSAEGISTADENSDGLLKPGQELPLGFTVRLPLWKLPVWLGLTYFQFSYPCE